MYQRKTVDEWFIESWNDDLKEWSLESTYDKYKDCIDDYKIYRYECPDIRFRIRKRRVKI